MDDLVKTGKVTRGYMGVGVNVLTDDLAKQLGVPDTAGALVEDVTPGGPAEKAGLKPFDVIRKLDGQTIQDSTQLTATVTNMAPGTSITLDILRDGKPQSVRLTLAERPADLSASAGGQGKAPSEGALRGIEVQALTPSIREQLGLPSNVRGVVISQLDPNSPAAQAQLQEGDVIQSISRQPVTTVAEFNRLAREAKGKVLLYVNRQGSGFIVVISPEGGDESGQ